ncbi:MAG: hypothetical protein KDD10_08575 [Phaeodactylibacter sp.]|nr:hypothetical protein [Phaeodactylibacter sp.]MCB9292446.1 hypothetical protein [Lewinellaceae bacterium]
MKHLFLGIALLLAATAAAQIKTGNWPVMRMSNSSQYLELKFGTAPSARLAPAEQPPRKFDADKPEAEERDLLAEYLLHLADWEACCPDKYAEEMEYMYTYLYKGETPLTADQLEYLIRTRRMRDQEAGK